VVRGVDEWWSIKRDGRRRAVGTLESIHMPRNTGTGVFLGALGVVIAFCAIWYVWWLCALSAVVAVVVVIAHTFDYQRAFHNPRGNRPQDRVRR
jgi:cytochrome o ubiquinol oxidase subunit 1